MKLRTLISTLAFIALFNIACDDAADNLGQKIQPTDDEIVVKADTFHLSTETLLADHFVSRPDSFLLGKFQDIKYGITAASILAEVRLSKDGFEFLDDEKALTQVDSVVMTLNVGSIFGGTSGSSNDGSSSLIHIGVYELRDSLKRGFDYMSDMDISSFVNTNTDKMIGDSMLSIRDGLTGKIHKQMRIVLTKEFTERFFTTNPAHYKNQNAFREFFNGVYITTDYFGHATMLNVRNITFTMYYNYAYRTNLNDKLYGQQDFHINSDVKKVNHITHPVRGFISDPTNEYSQVTSPSNHYTRIRVPIDKIYNKVKISDKNLHLNRASVKINVKKNDDTGPKSTHLPYVDNLLLIKESALERFFDKRESLSDTCAFIASMDSAYLKETKKYDYYYSFSGLSTLIEKEIKKKDENKSNAEYIDLVLIPVTPIYSAYNNQTTLSEIRHSNLLQSSTLFGGQNKENPMKLEIIYSGF